MKKLVIALVCVVLLAALTIPSIYSASKWPTYTLKFLGPDVTGTEDKPVVEQCDANKRFISSSSIDELRPTLLLNPEIFGGYYGVEHDGQCLDLTKHKNAISMQFFFFDPDTGEKIMLSVEDGLVSVGEWLESSFTIKYEKVDAVITTTKGKGKKGSPLLYKNVNITIQCEEE